MYLVTIQVIMPSMTVSMDTKLLESVVESVFTLVAGLVVILTVLKMTAMDIILNEDGMKSSIPQFLKQNNYYLFKINLKLQLFMINLSIFITL